jgi:hypothetical protein
MRGLAAVHLAHFAWLAAGCATITAAETAGRTWHELRTTRFRIATDGPVDLARNLAEDLERFHEVLMRETTAEEREAAPPLRIVLLQDADSLAALVPQARLQSGVSWVGSFVPSPRGNFVVLHTDPLTGAAREEQGRRRLFHEYAHYVMAMAGARAPSWYDEGFAEFFSTTEFREDGSYTLGFPPQRDTRGWIPLRTLFESGRIAELSQAGQGSAFPSRVRDAEPLVSDSYAQAWSIVHHFSTDPERKSRLARYLSLWQTGTTLDDAVVNGFGASVETLEATLQKYAAQPRVAYVTVKPARPLRAVKAHTAELSPARTHSLVADLLLWTQGPDEAVAALLEEAMRETSSDPAPVLALARLRLAEASAERREGEKNPRWAIATAERLVDAARKRGGESPEVLVLDGHLHVARAELAVGDRDAAEREILLARTAYRTAIRGDEALAEAYWALGRTYLTHDTGSEEAVVVLEAAGYLLPVFTAIPWTLARIRIARGEAAAAVAPLQYVLRWSRSLEQRAKALELLDRIRRDVHEAAPAQAPAEPTG